MGVFVHTLFHPDMAFWMLGIMYSFIWLPQIVRSARRNSGRALRKRYVIGTSLCRQFFALCKLNSITLCTSLTRADMFACPENVVGLEVTCKARYTLIC